MGEDITPALQPPGKQGQTRRRSHLGCRSLPSTHTTNARPTLALWFIRGSVVIICPSYAPGAHNLPRHLPSFSPMTEFPQACASGGYRLSVLSARHHHAYTLSCRPISPGLCPSIARLLPRPAPDCPRLAYMTCPGILVSTIVLRPSSAHCG